MKLTSTLFFPKIFTTLCFSASDTLLEEMYMARRELGASLPSLGAPPPRTCVLANVEALVIFY